MLHNGFRFRYCVFAFVTVASSHGIPNRTEGGEPIEVAFDCAAAISCRDVTPLEFAESNYHERIIEMVIPLSIRVIRGDSADLRELVFEIRSPQRRMRVVQFRPQTQLESVADGPIQMTETVEKQRSIGASLGGSVKAPIGDVRIEGAPSANLGVSKRNVVTETWKKLPPKQATVVSGTTADGYGVFFRFKRSTQESFEGVKELTLRFIVPASFRADWLLLSCRATGDRLKYFIKATVPCGERRYVLGLHSAGDRGAQRAAYELARLQSRISDKAAQARRQNAALADQPRTIQQAAEALRRLSVEAEAAPTSAQGLEQTAEPAAND